MTAKIGGDYYYHTYWHVGTGSGTEMVITGFTTPSTITSTSQTAAYGNYAGNYQNNSGVWGTVNGNANAYGYGSSQTTVGGSSTYQAVPYQFPIFENFVIVLASPQRTQQLIQQGALTHRPILPRGQNQTGRGSSSNQVAVKTFTPRSATAPL